MSDVVIKVEGLSKQYAIGGAERASNLRELVTRAFSPWRWLDNAQRSSRETFWAIQDVCFEVKRGDVVGVIGRNGAGKSTLLKLLSRITQPTKGRARIKGRVGSLLEVGTGFHSDLTGRENLFLSGAILGMSRVEVKDKFDEIVAFSGVEKFIDTPVKYYSSGMYLRLAFAVAAHLDPEILIVDEVLAVGDAVFQKKCLGKMNDVSRSGRTVLFVSHNMTAVEMLCSKAILLTSGRLEAYADTPSVIEKYQAGRSDMRPVWTEPNKAQPNGAAARFISVRIADSKYNTKQVYGSAESLVIELQFHLAEVHSDLTVGFDLKTVSGTVVFRSSQSDMRHEDWPKLKEGVNTLRCVIPGGFFNDSTYTIMPWITRHGKEWLCRIDEACEFEVSLNHGVSPLWASQHRGVRPGVVSPILNWESVR